jgi:hypothetical protein
VQILHLFTPAWLCKKSGKAVGKFSIGAESAPIDSPKLANRCSRCPLTRRAFDKIKALLLLIPVDKWITQEREKGVPSAQPI